MEFKVLVEAKVNAVHPVTEVHAVREAPEVSKAQEVLQTGGAQAMVAATDLEDQEDQPDGMDQDGRMATVRGDRLGGTDLVTTLDTVLISVQAIIQAGNPSRVSISSQSPSPTPMALGAIPPTVPMYTRAPTHTTVQTWSLIQAVMTSADITIRTMSGTTTRAASTTITTLRAATVSTANTTRTVSGPTTTPAHLTRISRNSTATKKTAIATSSSRILGTGKPQSLLQHLQHLQRL